MNQMKMNLRVKEQRYTMTRPKIKRSTTKKTTKHNLQIKRQNNVDYREKSFDEFRLTIVDPPQKLDSEK